ncbi:MAG TPA: hypothetical protein VJ729_01070 [Nitrososphaeraceae archaeon]|nr:hypothetical protein [Nitrososphaeraceae archaeon]
MGYGDTKIKKTNKTKKSVREEEYSTTKQKQQPIAEQVAIDTKQKIKDMIS